MTGLFEPNWKERAERAEADCKRWAEALHPITGPGRAIQDVDNLQQELTQALIRNSETLRKWSEDVNSSVNLKKELAEMKRKYGFTYCAYCGKTYEIDAPESVNAISEHIATCEKHPMRTVEAELDRVKAQMLENNRHHEIELEAKTDELERVNAACAEMREVLQHALNYVHLLDDGKTWATMQAEKFAIELALSSDAGKDFVPAAELDRVKRREAALLEVVKGMTTFCQSYLETVTHPGVSRLVADAKAALTLELEDQP